MSEIVVEIHPFTINLNTVQGRQELDEIIKKKMPCVPNYKIPLNQNQLRVGEMIRIPMELIDSKTNKIAGYRTYYCEIVAILHEFTPPRVYAHKKSMDVDGQRLEIQY